jgi:hypothetical protein
MLIWIFFLVLVCGTRAQSFRTFQLYPVRKTLRYVSGPRQLKPVRQNADEGAT